jgi:hypothetical protein
MTTPKLTSTPYVCVCMIECKLLRYTGTRRVVCAGFNYANDDAIRYNFQLSLDYTISKTEKNSDRAQLLPY